MSGGMRQTSNYVWSTGDVLGQGATGVVYKGRHKKSGELYAIKVFNSLSYMSRPEEVRMREFEVLQKVNHRNIVRLFDIEDDMSNKSKVIIMELCDAGSLFTMLDDPENMYGLDENDFKIVLRDITSGMSHLRDKGIVHRDLKPGNIMRSYMNDGSVVYKLTDFGAARELEDDEQFMSLYGTEEYLHPDIYEKAVLRKPAGKTFTSTVDLWSMGVTFYHVATGNLPYRPYGGARRNKEMMFKITTEKPDGAISGVQHSVNGQIEWSKELPKTCRLSEGFKRLFTPILAGILEGSTHKISTFQQYFTDVNNLLCLSIVDVFCVPNGTLYKIYIPADKMFAAFQEQVAVQTNIRAAAQQFLWERNLLEIDAFTPIEKYPKTSSENPLILFSTETSDFISIHIPHTCKPPKEKASGAISLENDSNLCKVCSSTLFDIKKSVTYLLLIQTHIRSAVKCFTLYLKSLVKQLEFLKSETKRKVDNLNTSLEIFEEHYNRETSLLHLLGMMLQTPPEVNDLKTYFTQITEASRQLRNHKSTFENLNEHMRSLHKTIVVDDYPLNTFVDEGSKPCDRLIEKMKVIADKSRSIYRTFRKHRHAKRLPQSEDQIHKFEKQKLAKICQQAVLLFTEHSVPGCKKLHKASQSWFCQMLEFRSKLIDMQNGYVKVSDSCDQMEEEVLNLRRIYKTKLTAAEEALKIQTERVNSPTSLMSNGMSSFYSAAPSYQPDSIMDLKQSLQVARASLVDVKSEVDGTETLIDGLSQLACLTNGVAHNS